jgi:Serine carboxypeptidase S28
LTDIKDAQYLYALVANSFASVVQFAFPQAIETECNLLINGEGTPLQNLADVIKRLYPAECLYVDYEGIINFYSSITEPFPGNNCTYYNSSANILNSFMLLCSAVRQYIYQTCTEFGWFTTLSGDTPFGNVVPVEFFIQTCSGVFGSQ